MEESWMWLLFYTCGTDGGDPEISYLYRTLSHIVTRLWKQIRENVIPMAVISCLVDVIF